MTKLIKNPSNAQAYKARMGADLSVKAQSEAKDVNQVSAQTTGLEAPGLEALDGLKGIEGTSQVDAAMKVLIQALGADKVAGLLKGVAPEASKAVVEAEPMPEGMSQPVQQVFRENLKEMTSQLQGAVEVAGKYHGAVAGLRSKLQGKDREPSMDEAQAFNAEVLEAWPTAPARFLLPTGEGGGTATSVDEITKISSVINGASFNNKWRDATVDSHLMPFLPGLDAAVKKHTMLSAHLQSVGLPTANEIALLKAEARDPEVPLEAIQAAVSKLIVEVELSVDGNAGKRETLQHESKTTSQGRVATVGKDGPMLGMASEVSYASGSSQTVGSGEVLNLRGRQYDVEVQNQRFQEPSGAFLHEAEVGIVAEKLLASRRMFEAMVERAPNDPGVSKLQEWMSDTTLTFQMQTGEEITLNMGSLRNDIAKLADAGLYPEARLKMLDDEMTESAPGGATAAFSGLAAFNAGGARPAAPTKQDAAADTSARLRAEASLERELGAVAPDDPGAAAAATVAEGYQRSLDASMGMFETHRGNRDATSLSLCLTGARAVARDLLGLKREGFGELSQAVMDLDAGLQRKSSYPIGFTKIASEATRAFGAALDGTVKPAEALEDIQEACLAWGASLLETVEAARGSLLSKTGGKDDAIQRWNAILNVANGIGWLRPELESEMRASLKANDFAEDIHAKVPSEVREGLRRDLNGFAAALKESQS